MVVRIHSTAPFLNLFPKDCDSVRLGVERGSADNNELVFLSIDLELHLVLVDGELDRGIRRDNVLVAGLLLLDLVFRRGRVNDVLLAEQRGGFLFVLFLSATIDRGHRNNRAGHSRRGIRRGGA